MIDFLENFYSPIIDSCLDDTMNYRKVSYRKEDRIGRITLEDPENMNVLSMRMLQELIDLFEKISKNRDVNCIIIESTGKAFSAGHDFEEIFEEDVEDIENLFQTCSEMMTRLRELPQPVIAKVARPAAAAGCQLVAACDLAIAGENAKFSIPGIKLGCFCSTPEVFVSRDIGRKRAFEMGITGEPISAEIAADWGLINRVVEEEDLEKETINLAKKIAKINLTALETGKRMFYKQINMEDFQALDYASEVISLNFAKEKAQKDIESYLKGEKRL